MALLSIHSMGHDTGVSIFENNKLICTIETERLTRVKHDHRSEISLEYILNYLKLKPKDIELVAVSTNIRNKILKIKNIETARKSIEKRNLHYETKCEMLGVEKPCIVVAHEASHAALAWHYAGYQKNCLILVNEGRGTFSRNSVYLSNSDRIDLLDYNMLPWYATGFGWSALGYLLNLGIGPSVAGTVMAFAGFGNVTEKYEEIINKIDNKIHYKSKSEMQDEAQKTKKKFNLNNNFKSKANLVSTFQNKFSENIKDYIKINLNKYEIDGLAFGGGCALNINTNNIIRKNFGKIAISPACNDSGQSLGAGIYVNKCLMGIETEQFSPYVNGFEDNSDIASLFEKYGLTFKNYDPDEMAKELANGAIVAYMDGISEIGPRALGNRSLLANPSIKNIKEKLSEKVKNREWFRPLSPIMTNETFEKLYPDEDKSPYMLFNYENRSDLLSGACHIDNTMRIQTLSKKMNPRLHTLLKLFEDRTGVQALINTSLNIKGKAIAYRAKDLIKDFLGTKVDIFVIGKFMAYNKL